LRLALALLAVVLLPLPGWAQDGVGTQEPDDPSAEDIAGDLAEDGVVDPNGSAAADAGDDAPQGAAGPGAPGNGPGDSRALGMSADELRDALAIGHWVRVKGQLDRLGWFVAQELEIRQPEGEEVLIGKVGLVVKRVDRFRVFGLPIHVTERTNMQGIDWDGLRGARVKVEGHYRGPSKFSAREVTPRPGGGRDRIEGRVDAIERRGEALVLRIMAFEVLLPADALIESEDLITSLGLAPAPDVLLPPVQRDDPENYIPISIALTETLGLGIQIESKEAHERNFDLDRDKPGNKRQAQLSAKAQLVWQPSADGFALARFRWDRGRVRDQDDPNTSFRDGDVSELYGYLRQPFGGGVDLQVGRQDFDDPREWIYDENLDAVRVHVLRQDFRLELSSSTRLTESSRANRETDNWIAYLSNDDVERHLAAWVVDRRRSGEERSKPLHAGVRMLGQWLPQQSVWAELSAVRGYEEGVDLRGWAVDLGTTWDLEPYYVTLGFAHGSGDDDPFDDVDTSHRQTGLHDNNGRFGGVTSFKYYGEVLEPELSNLDVYTAGLGMRVGRRSSLDLVLHKYRLVETYQLPPGSTASSPLLNSSLRARPDGIHDDLGWEADLVLGSRELKDWDLELVLGWFSPGDAFPGADPAWVWRTQLRYRF